MILHATARFTPRSDAGRFVSVVVTPASFAALNIALHMVLDEALSIVPVDTGALADSGKIVEAHSTGKTISGDVVFDAPHAGYVEYGTGRRGEESPGAGPYPYKPDWPGMAARPYLRPALDTVSKAIVEQFKSQLALRLNQ